MYKKGRLLRNTPRGKLAAEDAEISKGAGLVKSFSEVFGSPITKEDAPELYKLLTRMSDDAGDNATRTAKTTICASVLLLSMAPILATPKSKQNCQKMAHTHQDILQEVGQQL